jgi:hypothetical protein
MSWKRLCSTLRPHWIGSIQGTCWTSSFSSGVFGPTWYRGEVRIIVTETIDRWLSQPKSTEDTRNHQAGTRKSCDWPALIPAECHLFENMLFSANVPDLRRFNCSTQWPYPILKKSNQSKISCQDPKSLSSTNGNGSQWYPKMHQGAWFKNFI